MLLWASLATEFQLTPHYGRLSLEKGPVTPPSVGDGDKCK